MKEVYQMEKEELFRIYGSPDGLTKEQAENIRKDKGENVFTEKHKKSPIAVFMEQFKDLLVIILIIAAIVSVLSGNAESTAVILFVIVLNAVLGTVQYVKAEKSLDSLKKLSAPKAKVYRDGEIKEILSREKSSTNQTDLMSMKELKSTTLEPMLPQQISSMSY